MSTLNLEDLVDLAIEVYEDDDRIERELPTVMQMLKMLRAKRDPQPAAPPPTNYPRPMHSVVPENKLERAKQALPGDPDYIQDPTNPNSKAMRGKLRPFKGGKRYNDQGEVDETGGGFEI